ncbi:MAG: hypothetical protein C0468_02645, partial [Planctomyces sp.]|nr:hypothetical protein [Planctomyces sp.]
GPLQGVATSQDGASTVANGRAHPLTAADRAHPSRAAGASAAGAWVSVVVRGVVSLVLLAGAAGIFVALLRAAPRLRPLELTDAPLAVRVVAVRRAEVARTWEGFGFASAMRTAELSSQVTGRVVERPGAVEPGARVSAGDVIVRIDPTDAQARKEAADSAVAAVTAQLEALDIQGRSLGDRLRQADEELSSANAELERIRGAVETAGFAAAELDRVISSVRRVEQARRLIAEQFETVPATRARLVADRLGLRAEQRLAAEELARTRIDAPISGVLQRVEPRVGELMRAGDFVARVVDLTRIEVPVRLPAEAAASVRAGDQARLYVGGDTAAGAIDAVVGRIAPEADAQTRTVTVFVEFGQDPAGAGAVLPGRYLRAEVTTRGVSERIVIPRGAVSDDAVLIATESAAAQGAQGPAGWSAARREVRVAYARDGRLPEIDPRETQWLVLDPLSDLADGELVIVSNLDELRVGRRVSPVRSGPAAGSAGGGSPEAAAPPPARATKEAPR